MNLKMNKKNQNKQQSRKRVEKAKFLDSSDDTFDGPLNSKSRTITDPIFSFLILLSWGICMQIGHWALKNGDPSKIIHPSDYKGRFCGIDSDDNGDLLPPYYYPVDILGNGVCVNACPERDEFYIDHKSLLFCKEDDDLLGMLGCSYNGEILEDDPQMLVICGGCMYQSKSFRIMDYCLPKSAINLMTQVDYAANATGFDPLNQLHVPSIVPYTERFLRDLWTSRYIVTGVGVGGSILLGFIFLILLRVDGLAAGMVWISAICTPVAFGVGGYYSQKLYMSYKLNPEKYPQSEEVQNVIKVSGYILYALSGIIFCALVFLRKRIILAIRITKAAAKAVVAFPFTILYPLIQLAGYFVLIVPWCIVMIYLASTGEERKMTAEVFTFELSYTIYQYNDFVKFGFWFMVFVLFWTSEFIIAMGHITLSMCYSKWYFTVDKKKGIKASVPRCMLVAFAYHMGTAAFGSLVLAIIRLIRTVLLWIKEKIKNSGLNSTTADAAFCCCQCCLLGIQQCLKYLSKNAYIQTAIFSYSFCRGSYESFSLILRNAGRMFAVGIVSELSMIYCKLFIVSCSSIASYYLIEECFQLELHSVIGVVLVVVFLSWIISNVFLEVLGIAIPTILHCFLADEEMHPKGSYYCPKDLDDFFVTVMKK